MPDDYTPATIADVRRLRDTLEQQGKKLVFTNGCFDLLHAGHVRYLEQARASMSSCSPASCAFSRSR